MNEKHKKYLTYIIYTIIVALIFATIFVLGHFKPFHDFITRVEQSSFDLRQTIVSKYKIANSDIMILAVDDATYEYIMDKYGSWPISRKIWSDTIEFLEKAEPRNIVFDLLFLKPNLYDLKSDLKLASSIKKYDNVYLSMNFDNYNDRIRKSPSLDKKFQLNVAEGELQDNEYISFMNARTVMKDISENTNNIGLINVTRDFDGIIRNATPVFKYKGDYYPNLSLKVAMDVLDIDSVKFKNGNIVLDNYHYIPLDSTQRAVLNWYGKSKTFIHVPMWEVIDAHKNNDINYLQKFRNKIIYVGTTATSLSDIKSVPTEFNLAGVELHATFLNNVLDNNFIKKNNVKVDFIIALIISFLVGYCVLKTTSVFKTIIFLCTSIIFYIALSIFLMLQFNLWIQLVFPIIAMLVSFALSYCEKYLLKSKDYEQTYKLAVTDGLTQLFNHRYFQEQLIVGVNNFNRYQTKFSLILIDIDFFKKFNDTYGHQSGDCVLKQVANILKKNSRSSDVACRYGGEEMAIILTNTSKTEAVITANKVCSMVRNNKFILVNGEKVHVTISVGVATVGENGLKPQDIIEYSDKCLYKAKESGRDQVVFDV